MKKIIISATALIVTVLLVLLLIQVYEWKSAAPPSGDPIEYTGKAFVTIQDNQPSFSESELTTKAYEEYGDLDLLGRCGIAMACCGPELMPKDGEERESISHIQPSGWVQQAYDFVDGEYLYNRCHLIGWQLTAENANERNLITGTRYMNVEGMLPFENMVADYIRETGNHVMYRVKPHFYKTELVCQGVELEAYSVEDHGEGISFHVYCFNLQPGVTIDYQTGDSCLEGETVPSTTQSTTAKGTAEDFVLNTNSKRVHKPDCGSVGKIAAHNREDFHGTLQALLDQGYEKCGACFKEE